MKKNKFKDQVKQNSEIYQETLRILQAGGYSDSGGNWHDVKSSKPGSIIYQTLPAKKEYNNYEETEVKWEKRDLLAVARELKNNVLVLNPANSEEPPIECGGESVEEMLFRRTSIAQSLYSFSENTFEIFGNRRPKTYRYPIKTYGGIYTPNVTVFRATGLMKRPFTCSVASIAPFNAVGSKLRDSEILIIKGKIRAFFRIAKKFGHEKLVLPDVFQKELIKEVLEEKEFNKSFKIIVICKK